MPPFDRLTRKDISKDLPFPMRTVRSAERDRCRGLVPALFSDRPALQVSAANNEDACSPLPPTLSSRKLHSSPVVEILLKNVSMTRDSESEDATFLVSATGCVAQFV